MDLELVKVTIKKVFVKLKAFIVRLSFTLEKKRRHYFTHSLYQRFQREYEYTQVKESKGRKRYVHRNKRKKNEKGKRLPKKWKISIVQNQ